jgi:hypothetical protein
MSLETVANLRVSGQPLHYEITLEPLRLSTIPLLEVTVSPPRIEGYGVAAREELVWVADRPIFERVRFEADTYAGFRHGPTRQTEALAPFRDLPPGYNPRTVAWASRFARDNGFDADDPAPLVRALLQHIRPAATATRWCPAPTASTRSTSSGSTSAKASASTTRRRSS